MINRSRRGLLLMAGGIGAALLAANLIYRKASFPTVHYSVVLVAACVLAAITLLVFGGRDWKYRHATEQLADYRPAVRLLLATTVALAAIGLLLDAFVPTAHGHLGLARPGAVADARAWTPKHVGNEACAACHQKQASAQAKDAHTHVACEACHGVGNVHAAFHEARKISGETGSIPSAVELPTPKQREWCLQCHQREPARAIGFPQVVWTEHMKLTHVIDPAVECIACHDPHEPLFMDRDIRTARLHPLIQECRSCHATEVEHPLPESHTPIFECGYCHEEVQKRQSWTPHKDLECTTCHPFFRETASAGRIVKDTDPRFCLLCHKRAKYRSKDGPPGISWPKHIKKMRDGATDKRKLCNECHREALHWPKEDFWADDDDEEEDEETEDSE